MENLIRHRIFIAEDHKIVRYGMSCAIAKEPDLEVCGQAESAAEALDGIRSARPNLLLLDLTLRDSFGLDVLEDLPTTTDILPLVLVMSMHAEETHGVRALRLGARGYLEKVDDETKLIEAIRTVLAGRLYARPETVMEAMGGHSSAADTSYSVRDLSNQELHVFELLGRGTSTEQIAEQLKMGHKTVNSYCDRIKTKLGARDWRALLRMAMLWVERGIEPSADTLPEE